MWYLQADVLTHASGSRVSIVSNSVILSVCLYVCLHDKTKTAETKIVKLGTGIIHHDTSPSNEYSVKGRG